MLTIGTTVCLAVDPDERRVYLSEDPAYLHHNQTRAWAFGAVAVEIAIPEPSRDLYEVKVTFCDGVTLDTEVLAAHTDVHVEMLADVARWVS